MVRAFTKKSSYQMMTYNYKKNLKFSKKFDSNFRHLLIFNYKF